MTFKEKALDSYTTREVPQGTKSGRPDFHDMPKCQARAKSTGEKCKNVAVKGKRVCYLHGGRSTGPKTEEGKKKAKYARLRHGDYSAQVKENRRKINALNRYLRMLGYFK